MHQKQSTSEPSTTTNRFLNKNVNSPQLHLYDKSGDLHQQLGDPPASSARLLVCPHTQFFFPPCLQASSFNPEFLRRADSVSQDHPDQTAWGWRFGDRVRQDKHIYCSHSGAAEGGLSFRLSDKELLQTEGRVLGENAGGIKVWLAERLPCDTGFLEIEIFTGNSHGSWFKTFLSRNVSQSFRGGHMHCLSPPLYKGYQAFFLLLQLFARQTCHC